MEGITEMRDTALVYENECEKLDYFTRYIKGLGTYTFINTSLNKYEEVEKQVTLLLEELKKNPSFIYIVEYRKGLHAKQWCVTIYSLEGITTYHVDCLLDSEGKYKLAFIKHNHFAFRECFFYYDLSNDFLKHFSSEDEYESILSYERNRRKRLKKSDISSIFNTRPPTVDQTLSVLELSHKKYAPLYEDEISSLYSICTFIRENTLLLKDNAVFEALKEAIESYQDSSFEDVELFSKCANANLHILAESS
jgi:hypothetical protein